MLAKTSNTWKQHFARNNICHKRLKSMLDIFFLKNLINKTLIKEVVIVINLKYKKFYNLYISKRNFFNEWVLYNIDKFIGMR